MDKIETIRTPRCHMCDEPAETELPDGTPMCYMCEENWELENSPAYAELRNALAALMAAKRLRRRHHPELGDPPAADGPDRDEGWEWRWARQYDELDGAPEGPTDV